MTGQNSPDASHRLHQPVLPGQLQKQHADSAYRHHEASDPLLSEEMTSKLQRLESFRPVQVLLQS